MSSPLIFVVGEAEVYHSLQSMTDLEVFSRHWDSLGDFLASAKKREIPGDHSPTVVVVSEAARQQDVNLEGFISLVRELTVLIPWHHGPEAPKRYGVIGVELPVSANTLRAAIAARAKISLPPLTGGDTPLHVPGFQELGSPGPAPSYAPADTGYAPPPAGATPSHQELAEIHNLQPERPLAPQPMAPQPMAPAQPTMPMAPQAPPQPMAPQPMAPQAPPQPMAPQPMAPAQPTMPMAPQAPPQPMAPPGGAPYQQADASWHPQYASPQAPAQVPGYPGVPHIGVRGSDFSANPFGETRVIAVYSSKGGVGKSTMSLNLAARLAHVTDLSVCVIDLDVGFGDIAPRLGKFSPTIIEALREPELNGDTIMSKLVREETTGMYALLAPLRPDAGADRSLLHPSAYDRVLRALRQRMHVVFLDCSVDLRDPLVAQFALVRSDAIGVVVNNERATLLDAKRALEAMCRSTQTTRPGLGIDPAKIGVILNQKVDRVSVTERDVVQLLKDYPVIASIPDDRELWIGQTNMGRLLATAGIPEIDEALDNALMSLLPGLDLTGMAAQQPAPTSSRQGKKPRKAKANSPRSGSSKSSGGLMNKLLGR